MGLISKATLLAAGYVLGARAGTDRYEQIVKAARKVANRPELQPYLGAPVARTSPPGEPAPGSRATTADAAPATTTAAAAVTVPPPVIPPVVPPVVEPPASPPAPRVTVTGRGSSSRGRSS